MPATHPSTTAISRASASSAARGIPLGIICGTAYEEKEVQLSEGDRLLMFSDGLTEAHDLSDDMFGFERIQDGLEQLRHYPELTTSDLIIHSMLEKLAAFIGPGTEQEDDVTLVSVRRLSRRDQSLMRRTRNS